MVLGCYWLKDYFISHPEVKKELTICEDPEVLKDLPNLLMTQAQEFAKIGKNYQVKILLEDAKKIDSNLTFNVEAKVKELSKLAIIHNESTSE